MRLTHLTLAATLAITPFVAVPAEAQTVDRVRVAVWDPQTKNELQNVAVGETIQMQAGSSLMLRLFQPSSGDQDRQYLPGTWRVQAGHDRVELSQIDASRGSVIVTARAATSVGDANQRVRLRYDLADEIQVARGYQKQGSLDIAITGGVVAPPSTAPGTSVDAGAWTERLYRGILLRGPDAGGARAYQERIAGDGYQGVLQVAQEIAGSRESTIDVYERTCNQQRLIALYQHLLDVPASQIDQSTFQRQLQRMESGDIQTVVTEMMRSERFQQLFGGERRLVRPRN